jgi:hypothetical protein
LPRTASHSYLKMRADRTMKRLALTSLVFANLMPVLGILALEWDLFSILFFYWLESAVVGAYNIPRMMMIEPSPSHKLSGILFFLVHYSFFMAGHGAFIFALFERVAIEITPVVVGISLLIISHGLSFLVNYVGRKEYQRVSLSEQMVAPYRRIMVMHLAIILCAFLLNLLGTNQITLIILILLKVAIDAYAHWREHRRLGTYVSDGVSGDA